MQVFSVKIAALTALVLVLGALSQVATAADAASKSNVDALRTYKVGKRTFTGKPKTVCVIEGKWNDGNFFRYQAWDTCNKINVSWVAPKSVPQTVEQIHGPDKTFVIPAGSEGFHIGNDYSIVWIYRDSAGQTQEILISD